MYCSSKESSPSDDELTPNTMKTTMSRLKTLLACCAGVTVPGNHHSDPYTVQGPKYIKNTLVSAEYNLLGALWSAMERESLYGRFE